MSGLKLPVSSAAFGFACFVLTSSNALSLIVEASLVKKILGFACLIILVYIVMTGSSKLKLVSLPILVLFVLTYVSDIFAGIVTYGFDSKIIFFLLNNLVGIILFYILMSQTRIMKNFGAAAPLKILIFMICFSLFTPLALIEIGVVSPGARYIYFGNRYAGFSWELTSIFFALTLTSVLLLKTKVNFFYKFLFTLIIFIVFYLKVFSNFAVLSIYFLILSFIVSYQKFYFNKFVYFLGAILAQMWEVIIVVFLEYFSLFSLLKINSENGRVMGRVEAAVHNLRQDEFSLTIYQSLFSSLEAGVDSFQHGINQFYFSATGLFIVTLVNLAFVTKIYQIRTHGSRFILTFIYFVLAGHFGFNFAIMIMLFVFFQIYQKFNEENRAY